MVCEEILLQAFGKYNNMYTTQHNDEARFERVTEEYIKWTVLESNTIYYSILIYFQNGILQTLFVCASYFPLWN